jgi:preprotein translocase subunit SecD
LRAAIEHGWTRARRTIIAADFVSLLAAVVLYVVSVGNVRGFAFALGLTTVIDLIIVFLFTKPLLSWLGGRRFVIEGSRWSGLDPERLGARRKAVPAAKRAHRTAQVEES